MIAFLLGNKSESAYKSEAKLLSHISHVNRQTSPQLVDHDLPENRELDFISESRRQTLVVVAQLKVWLAGLSWKWSVRFGYSSERAADVTLDERTNKMRALQQRIVPLPSRSSRWYRLLLLLLAWMDRDMLVFWSYQKGVELMSCMLLRDGMFGF